MSNYTLATSLQDMPLLLIAYALFSLLVITLSSIYIGNIAHYHKKYDDALKAGDYESALENGKRFYAARKWRKTASVSDEQRVVRDIAKRLSSF